MLELNGEMYGLFIDHTNIREMESFFKMDNDLCIEGRIPGALKIGSYWAIPEDAEKPKDKRVRRGKYIKDIGKAVE